MTSSSSPSTSPAGNSTISLTTPSSSYSPNAAAPTTSPSNAAAPATTKPTTTPPASTTNKPAVSSATPTVFGTCKASVPATCKAPSGSLASQSSKPTGSTYYITKTTITGPSSTWVSTMTSVIPLTGSATYGTGVPSVSASGTTTGAISNPSQFNAGIPNAPLDHAGLGLAFFVIYIFHFLFRV